MKAILSSVETLPKLPLVKLIKCKILTMGTIEFIWSNI